MYAPDNFKEKELFNKLLSYFEDYIDKDLINNPITIRDIDELKRKQYLEVPLEYFKIYFNDVFEVLEKSKEDKQLYERFIKNNLDYITYDYNVIDNELLSVANNYKQKKGNIAGFYFINSLVENIAKNMNSDGNKYFSILETNIPYKYEVKSSLYPEVYKSLVLPLTHPVGFEFDYKRIITLILKDYFSYIENRKISDIYMICNDYKKTDLKDIHNGVKDIIINKNIDLEEEIYIIYNDNYKILKQYNRDIYEYKPFDIKKIESVSIDDKFGKVEINDNLLIFKLYTLYDIPNDIEVTFKHLDNDELQKFKFKLPKVEVSNNPIYYDDIVLDLNDYDFSVLRGEKTFLNQCIIYYDIKYTYEFTLKEDNKYKLIIDDWDYFKRDKTKINKPFKDNKIFDNERYSYNHSLSNNYFISKDKNGVDWEGIKYYQDISADTIDDRIGRDELNFVPDYEENLKDINNPYNIPVNAFIRENIENDDYLAREYLGFKAVNKPFIDYVTFYDKLDLKSILLFKDRFIIRDIISYYLSYTISNMANVLKYQCKKLCDNLYVNCFKIGIVKDYELVRVMGDYVNIDEVFYSIKNLDIKDKSKIFEIIRKKVNKSLFDIEDIKEILLKSRVNINKDLLKTNDKLTININNIIKDDSNINDKLSYKIFNTLKVNIPISSTFGFDLKTNPYGYRKDIIYKEYSVCDNNLKIDDFNVCEVKKVTSYIKSKDDKVKFNDDFNFINPSNLIKDYIKPNSNLKDKTSYNLVNSNIKIDEVFKITKTLKNITSNLNIKEEFNPNLKTSNKDNININDNINKNSNYNLINNDDVNMNETQNINNNFNIKTNDNININDNINKNSNYNLINNDDVNMNEYSKNLNDKNDAFRDNVNINNLFNLKSNEIKILKDNTIINDNIKTDNSKNLRDNSNLDDDIFKRYSRKLKDILTSLDDFIINRVINPVFNDVSIINDNIYFNKTSSLNSDDININENNIISTNSKISQIENITFNDSEDRKAIINNKDNINSDDNITIKQNSISNNQDNIISQDNFNSSRNVNIKNSDIINSNDLLTDKNRIDTLNLTDVLNTDLSVNIKNRYDYNIDEVINVNSITNIVNNKKVYLNDSSNITNVFNIELKKDVVLDDKINNLIEDYNNKIFIILKDYISILDSISDIKNSSSYDSLNINDNYNILNSKRLYDNSNINTNIDRVNISIKDNYNKETISYIYEAIVGNVYVCDFDVCVDKHINVTKEGIGEQIPIADKFIIN